MWPTVIAATTKLRVHAVFFWGPRDHLKTHISKEMRLMEIGPLTRGLAPKREGWNTCIVDQMSRDQLIEAYEHLGGARRYIEAVDIVWRIGPLHDAVEADDRWTFDAIICAHVLEHLTDPVAFLQSTERLLKPGGMLLLVLPDKRFSFDYFRPLTMTGDLIESYRTKPRNHHYRTAFNHVAYCASKGGTIAWELSFLKDLTFISDLKTAMQRADAQSGPDGLPGFDFHAWCFVPSSFALIALELSQLGLTTFAVQQISPQRHAEFFVGLKLGAGSQFSDDQLPKERMKLLRRTLAENAQQGRLASAGGMIGASTYGVLPELVVAACETAAYRLNFRLYVFVVRSHQLIRRVSAGWRSRTRGGTIK